MSYPQSCDTFVVLPPYTKDGVVVFGKNSDRPQNEVQELIYVKGRKQEPNKIHCTYISIDPVETPSNSVILSKPAWMWGAEMGANDKNVVIGNEAVWTNYNDDDGDASHQRLIGMDLVRLGLERGKSAEEALDVITSLLEKYGQGGPCSETDKSLTYHNSFLIADPKTAWVLETSGSLWAAEKVETGFRNISNGLTITTKIDKSSKNLKDKARKLGLWDGQGELNFTQCFSSGGDEDRQQAGERLLAEAGRSRAVDAPAMCRVLRDKPSRICRACDDAFPTQGSQVSKLTERGDSVHWFTATPDPSVSNFKPFVFTENAQTSPHTVSPVDEKAREHKLYKSHKKFVSGTNESVEKVVQELEERSFAEVEELAARVAAGQRPRSALDRLMLASVETELKMYN